MFTRVVAVRTKPGKARDLSKTIHDKILYRARQNPCSELLGKSARCRALHPRTISEDKRAHLPPSRERTPLLELTVPEN